MSMTMTQKILAEHAGVESVKAGELVLAKVDLALGNDITAPVAIREFEKMGAKEVFDRSKIAIVLDHFAPNKDIKAAQQCKMCREFCAKHQIEHFFDVGCMGIEHALLPEKGLFTSGDLVIGADSHTCTYGGLGAFSTGVGSTDLAFAMATGKAWFKVPAAIKFVLSGRFERYVSGKDLILSIIGKIGVDGALCKSMEFVVDSQFALDIYDRLTICNMAIEAGAKNGIFEPDGRSLEYFSSRSSRKPKNFFADHDAQYDEVHRINLSEVEPTVALPSLPSNTVLAKDAPKYPIDQVVIGSCTNGHYKDLEQAAELLAGRKAAKGVRVIVIPATQSVYLRAARSGLLEKFVEAGCAVSTPTCGPCLGGHMGVLAKGERAVATTNRNFVGRMGDPESEVVLASPAVAAASAIMGRIADPREVV